MMTNTRNRSRAWTGAALTFGVAALVAFSTLATRADAQTRVVIGTPGSINDASLAIQVAIDKGYYRDAGVSVEAVDFKGGAPAIQALVGNGINYAISAPEHVIRLRNRGIDGVVAFAFETRHTYVLLTKDSSPIKQFTDLKGKRAGITSSGSLPENLIRLEAKRAGLSLQQPRLSRDGLFTKEAFERLQDDLVELEPEIKRVWISRALSRAKRTNVSLNSSRSCV